MRFVSLSLLAASAVAVSACSSEPAAEAPAAEASAPAAAAGAATAQPASTEAVLDPNTATAEQLAGVSGFTPELAQAVIAGRPYASASAFNAKLLETLSPEQAAAVRTRVFVPIDLNTASEADIELVPGMTDKMVHEFLEYRPYANLAEFDREIGKYVDAEEVARLRRYVTL